MLAGGKGGNARPAVRPTYRDVPGAVFIGERGPAQSGAGGRRVPYSHGHRVQLRRGVAGRQTDRQTKGSDELRFAGRAGAIHLLLADAGRLVVGEHDLEGDGPKGGGHNIIHPVRDSLV